MQLSAPPLIFLVVLIAGAVLLTLAIKRGAVTGRPPWRSAARTCQNTACRAANSQHARYCAQCGQKLS